MNKILHALQELKEGRPILVYDSEGREEETDIVVPADFATPELVRMLRSDGGGLLCLAIHPEIANKLGIPFLTDVWKDAISKYPVFEEVWPNDIPYDEKSSFSITINHRDTFTGITDNDRSLTITELARLGENILKNEYMVGDFGREFRSPGHVILLRAAEGLLKNRKGHTELSVALMEMAGLTPMTAICEMLGSDGNSLRIADSKEYAKRNGLAFIEGKEAIETFLSGEITPLTK